MCSIQQLKEYLANEELLEKAKFDTVDQCQKFSRKSTLKKSKQSHLRKKIDA